MPRRNKPIKHTAFQPQTTCSTKRRFNDEASAERGAQDQMLINMTVQLHTYKCDQCSGWHLTRTKNPRQT